MKRFLLAIIAISGALSLSAQDTTKKEGVDTIRVGGIVIIRDKNKEKDGDNKNRNITISNRKRKKSSNINTNFLIVDLGFANLSDKTNYSSAEAQAFAPGFTDKDQLELRTKSINVNLWFFMQRVNLIKRVVNLKYGLGLELNNYLFDDQTVRLTKNPTIFTHGPDVEKNKLAADYLTVPMMLNFNFTPNRKKGFGLSAGVSAGYLYSSRQKIKEDGDKDKLRDDFNLRKWKLSYIGELSLGPVKLYGSYAMKSMWEKGLDQTPYNVGIRLSAQ